MNIYPNIPLENGIYEMKGFNSILESTFMLYCLNNNEKIFYITNDAKESRDKFTFLKKNIAAEINYIDSSYYTSSEIISDKAPLINDVITDDLNTKRIVIFDNTNFDKKLKLLKHSETLKVEVNSSSITRELLLDTIRNYNYVQKDFVESIGEYSERGSIIDIFSPNFEKPIRIQFFKNKISSIATFNVNFGKVEDKNYNYIKIYKLKRKPESAEIKTYELIPKNSLILIGPEILFKNSKIINYIKKKHKVFIINPLTNLGVDFCTLKIEYPEIDKYMGFDEKIKFLDKKYKFKEINFLINNKNEEEYINNNLTNQLERNFFFGKYTKTFYIKNSKSIFVSHNNELKDDRNKFDDFKKLTYKFKNFAELNENDYLVHKEYGICTYNGLVKKNINETNIELVKCIFDGGDLLFVPSLKINLLQKYVGNKNEVKIDSLRTKSWIIKVKKAKKIAEKVAKEILTLYAKRKISRGYSFNFNPNEINEFEKNFQFIETKDQLSAINDVYNDMRKDNPMDRLVCGDVGFGKTEIALRAAYLSAINAKQVAIIAPTTLLVNQHLETFNARFRDFPINIESVSRNTTNKKFNEIIENLYDSKIDIIIGTHKLLNDKIKFKNLGLIIIDEEHKFGVKQKEKIKQVRMGVDYLALSATPIPRTLQLSLSGIKDISIIATPPTDRLSIDTTVEIYNEKIIKEAIQNELNRDGRVFFIHNEIKSIENVYKKLKSILPNVKIKFIHGKMNADEIENSIIDFIHGKISVLLTTTIIESGIDIQEANTIIINNANKFGLSDLYQIRGRIGRSNKKGFAYLLIDKKNKITKNAIKRLNAIKSLSSLGSGFNLAIEDLEIRGAGNLFGTDQSGNIYDVGIEFYLELLDAEIRKINKNILDDLINFEINTNENISIPENYIQSAEKRIYYYKRISNVESKNECNDIIEELLELFGTIPSEIENLIKIAELKIILKELKIYDFVINQKNIIFKTSNIQKMKKVNIYVNNFNGRIVDAKTIFSKIDNLETFIKENAIFSKDKFLIDFESIKT